MKAEIEKAIYNLREVLALFVIDEYADDIAAVTACVKEQDEELARLRAELEEAKKRIDTYGESSREVIERSNRFSSDLASIRSTLAAVLGDGEPGERAEMAVRVIRELATPGRCMPFDCPGIEGDDEACMKCGLAKALEAAKEPV